MVSPQSLAELAYKFAINKYAFPFELSSHSELCGLASASPIELKATSFRSSAVARRADLGAGSAAVAFCISVTPTFLFRPWACL